MKQSLRKNARVTSFLRNALKPLFVACALAPVCVTSHALAVIPAPSALYWDGATTQAGAATGTGSWDLVGANTVWTTDSAGVNHTAWTNNNNAFFGTSRVTMGGTITVNGPIIANMITFNTTGYDLKDGTGTLTLSSAGNPIPNQIQIVVNLGISATIGSKLNDTTTSDTLLITTGGAPSATPTTLTLSGNNTGPIFQGKTITLDGAGQGITLVLQSQQALPQFSDITVQNAATLNLNGFTQSNGIASLSGNGRITNVSGTNAVLIVGASSTGNLIGNTSTNLPADASAFSGGISDTANTIETTSNAIPAGGLGLKVTSSGTAGYTLILSGTSNTYHGKTIVGAGTPNTIATLRAGAAGAFSANSAVDVQSGGVLDLRGFNQTVAALDGAGTGTITNLAQNTTTILTFGNPTLTGPLTSNASINDGAGNGVIGLTKNGGYSQILAGNNNYSGPTAVTAGTLAAGSTTGFSGRSAYNVGTTLDLNGYNSSIGSLTGAGLVTNGSLTAPNPGAGTLTTGLDNTTTSFSGVIQNSASGALALTKAGSGTFTVTGNNTYAGGTTLVSGGLYADPAAAGNTPLSVQTITITSPTGSAVLGTTTGVSLSNPISIQGNFSVAAGTPSSQDLTFIGPVYLNNSSRAIAGINGAANAGAQIHFQGVINGGTPSTPSGTGGVAFIGATPYTAFLYDGTAANTYTGLTTVGQNAFLVLLQKTVTNGAVIGDVLVTGNGSVDYLDVSNQIADTSNVTVNSSGLDAGKHFQGLELRNNSDTIGNLFGSSSGTVGLGSGTLTVNGGNFSGNILDGQFGQPGTGGNLTKIGNGSLTLGGVNSYTGKTTVTAGSVVAGSNTGFSPNSAFTVTAPSFLDVNGFSTTVGSLAGNGTVTNNSTTPGSITTGFDNTSTTFTGSLRDGNGTLAVGKVGTGAFTITNSTYSGITVVAQGTLKAGSTSAFSPNSAFTVNTPGVADLNGFSNSIGSLAGNGVFTNNGATAATLTTGLDGTSTAFTGTLQDGTSTIALTKTGTGTFTISNAAYSGPTNVNQGTLQAGSTSGFTPFSTYTITGGGILDVNGFNSSVASLAGNGTVLNNGAAPASLTTGFDNTSTAFTGTLKDGSAAFGLTKTGTGIFTISNSTYSGATNIFQGTLRAGSTTAFSPNSSFNVQAPGIADINGFNNGIGSLTGNGTVTNNGGASAVLTTGLDNTTTIFSGTIQDGTSPIALTKTGAGALILASPNTFSGGTVLNGGALVLANSLGLGRGNVTVAGGSLQAGGTNASIQVGGNYTQTSGGELALRIGGTTAGSFDRLSVVGSAALGGRLTVNTTNGFTPKQTSSAITIITAGGPVSGTFASVKGTLTTNPLVSVTAEYLPNSVVLEFGQGSFSALNSFGLLHLTPNEKAVASALDNLATNGRSTRLVNFLDAQPLGKLPAAFDRIAPEEYGAAYEISRSAAKMTANSVETRLDQIHASGRLSVGAPGAAGPSDGKGSKEILPPADYRLGVFANGSGEFVSVGDTSNAAGYDFDSGGVTIGADYRFTDNFVAGVLFNYTRTRADLTGSGRLDADAFRGGVYASLFGGGAYVNGYVGAGYNDYDVRRDGLDTTVRGKTNGGEFNALIATGYDVHAGNFTYGPVASFQYTYTGLSSLNETGSLAPLHINSGKGDSLRTNIGARASYDWHIGGYTLTPEVRATYQHEFGDTFEQTTASLLAGSPNFSVSAAPIGRDSLVLNAGFTLTISPQWAVYAFYDGELARQNYQANNVLVGARASF